MSERTNISLRTYQKQIINKTKELMLSGERSILIQSPTGSGKTLLTAHMLRSCQIKGMRSFFIVHRRELVKQSIEALKIMNVRHGVIAQGWSQEPNMPTYIASIQTLIRRYEKLQKPSLIVWDEAHHCAAGSWKKIYNAFPDSFHIGLTATPQRLDGKGLKQWFSNMIHGPSIQWLIDNKFLANYKIYAPSNISMDGVHSRMGDFIQSEVEDIIDKPTITGDAIKHYMKLCNGKRAVVFCVSIKHSKHVVDQFNGSGIFAYHIDGTTSRHDRDDALRRFSSGEIKVLSNVDLFGEGFDVPTLEAAILLRPTKSLVLYLQQIGRALRPCEGKECAIILDHAGNCKRHGFPDDEREWSLDGRNKSDKKPIESIRTCIECFAALKPTVTQCPYCGFIFQVNFREIDEVDGDLIEVNPEELRKKRMSEQGKCESLEDLVALGKSRGYKRPYLWGRYVWNYRKARMVA